MIRMRRQNKLVFLLLILLGISIGYALVSTTLKITGLANIKNNTWDIHFENVRVKSGSAEATTPANIADPTTVSFTVTLNNPGDYYEFTVEVVNNGTLNGEITAMNFDVYDQTGTTKLDDEDIPSYISKSFGLANGNEIPNRGILNAGKKENYKIRVEYTDNIEEKDLEKDFNCVFKFSMSIRQTKSEASSTGTITFVANTDSNVKGLIGTAYLDPTDYSIVCNSETQTERMPLYAATSWAEIDNYMGYPGYYESATSYASNNSGCMKFYVYKDTGDNYKLILDHNTTAVVAPVLEEKYIDEDTGDGYSYGKIDYCISRYSTDDEINTCLYLYDDILKRDTTGWVDQHPTMMTAEEVAEILEIDNFDDSSYPEDIEIETGYEWLFDNTETGSNDECLEPSCFVDGFWTNSIEITDIDTSNARVYYNMWGISSFGNPYEPKTFLFHRDAQSDSWYLAFNRNIGIRPVITVPIEYFNN